MIKSTFCYLKWKKTGVLLSNLLVALFIVAPLNLMAQNILPDTGSVGVGTTSPISLFHAKGNVELTSGHGVGSMTIGDNTGTFFQVAGSRRGTDTTNQFQGGFGFLSGSSQVSPIIWMYGHSIRNAFQIRSKGYNGKVQDAPVLFHVGVNHKVGIGTSAPNSKLHVAGNVAINDEIKASGFRSNTSSGYNFMLRTDSSKPTLYVQNSNVNGDLLSMINGTAVAGAGGINRLIVKGNGNVGIGTTTPSSKLELSSSTNTYLRITTTGDSNSDNNGIHFSHKRPNSTIYSRHKIYSNRYNLIFDIDEEAIFMNNGNNTLTLGRNSKVGIGTTTPITDLTLKSGTDGISFQSSSNSFNSGKIAVIKPSEAGSGYGDLVFETFQGGSGGGERLRILNNGKVGIGTSIVPSDYLVAIDGKIITEKVVVRNSGNWPDYVFHKNYNLPKLSEVEDFINANNHLPEIPSAKDIETNGQDLGEMNRLLLKKVEELTLYTIDQSKEIELLKFKVSEVEHLKKEMDLIKSKLQLK